MHRQNNTPAPIFPSLSYHFREHKRNTHTRTCTHTLCLFPSKARKSFTERMALPTLYAKGILPASTMTSFHHYPSTIGTSFGLIYFTCHRCRYEAQRSSRQMDGRRSRSDRLAYHAHVHVPLPPTSPSCRADPLCLFPSSGLYSCPLGTRRSPRRRPTRVRPIDGLQHSARNNGCRMFSTFAHESAHS